MGDVAREMIAQTPRVGRPRVNPRQDMQYLCDVNDGSDAEDMPEIVGSDDE